MKFEICYPNYSKKALTFTLDDGNVRADAPMIEQLRAAGMRGSFNLCHTASLTPEEYRELYSGFEICNHVKCHPFVFADGVQYEVKNQPLDNDTADPDCIYRDETSPDLFYIHRPRGWRRICDVNTYIKLIEECNDELKAVFGGEIRGFVYPFREQECERLKEYLYSHFKFVRKTGCTGENGGFEVPRNRHPWSYNADAGSLLLLAESFRNYEDDGELKCFIWGVHSADYEKENTKTIMPEFLEKYGNCPDEFWYTTVGELFDYVDAADSLVLTDTALHNPSPFTLYYKVDGERCTILPGATVLL